MDEKLQRLLRIAAKKPAFLFSRPSRKTPQRAKLTKQKYLKAYRRAGAAAGYHFLTGREENIQKLAEVVGFRYQYDPKTRQYAHAAVTMILMPDGRVDLAV